MGSTGRLALLIVLVASTGCSFGVRRSQHEENQEQVVAPPPPPASPSPKPKVAVNPPTVRTMTEAELAKAQQDYQAGVEAFEWGRYSDAAQYFEDAYRIAPKMDELQEYLERTYIALGMERYTAGEPDEAIAIWKKVLRIDPSDEKAKAYIARTQEEIARLPADDDR